MPIKKVIKGKFPVKIWTWVFLGRAKPGLVFLMFCLAGNNYAGTGVDSFFLRTFKNLEEKRSGGRREAY